MTNLERMSCLAEHDICNSTVHVRNQGEHLEHMPPEIFKTLHSNFDICRNLQRIKMKFYILIIFKKSYWNFSLSHW